MAKLMHADIHIICIVDNLVLDLNIYTSFRFLSYSGTTFQALDAKCCKEFKPKLVVLVELQ